MITNELIIFLRPCSSAAVWCIIAVAISIYVQFIILELKYCYISKNCFKKSKRVYYFINKKKW
jgi:hypothetical protein